MKRRAFLASMAAAALTPTLMSAPAPRFKFVYAHDYAPFSWLDQNNQLRGILVDTIHECWANRLKVNIEHLGLPWSRAQMLVRQQRADAFCTAVTPQRMAYTKVSEVPVIEEHVQIVTNIAHAKIRQLRQVRDIEDLKPFRIASYLGNGWSQLHFGGYDVENTRSLAHALRMVANGHADVVIDLKSALQFTIMQTALKSQLMFLDTVLDQVSFHMMIGKDSPFTKFIPEFNRQTLKMQEDGTIATIRDQYLLG